MQTRSMTSKWSSRSIRRQASKTLHAHTTTSHTHFYAVGSICRFWGFTSHEANVRDVPEERSGFNPPTRLRL
jgi:hypothetical protein